MIRLVIFDLDGTLVNSIYDLADSVNYALLNFGYPTHDTEKYRYFVGNGTKKLCERALPEDKRNDAEIERLHEVFLKRYSQSYLNNTVLYDGIGELLSGLLSMGVKCAVASNKTDVFTKMIIDKLLGLNLFCAIIGKREEANAKPSPDIVYEILKTSGVSESDAIIAGDSDVDILTAKNSGIRSVGCLWGFRTYAELKDAGADYIIKKPSELLKIIQEG